MLSSDTSLHSCGWRIFDYYLKTITQTVVFLKTTIPSLLCHEGSAGTPRTFINHDGAKSRLTPGRPELEMKPNNWCCVWPK